MRISMEPDTFFRSSGTAINETDNRNRSQLVQGDALDIGLVFD